MNPFQELASCLNSAYLCIFSKIFTVVDAGAREGDKTNVVLSSWNLHPNVLRKERTSLPFILQVLIILCTTLGFHCPGLATFLILVSVEQMTQALNLI